MIAPHLILAAQPPLPPPHPSRRAAWPNLTLNPLNVRLGNFTFVEV